jgi:Tfp pilus assembly protein PilX
MMGNEGMKQNNIRKNQDGMAAIIVTVVLMMVITLITLGFSQVIRREQRNTLDHQLATQAYYAAESGVNLAQSKIKSIVAAGSSVPAKNNCDETYGATNFTSAEYNIGAGVNITCLLIQPKVSTLEYQKVDAHAVPMLVKADSGTIRTIHISWQKPSNSATTGCAASMPAGNKFGPTTGASPNWTCNQPLLRIDLIALPDSGSFTRPGLLSKQFTSFLYPVTGAVAPTGYSAGSITGINAVNCNAAVSPLTRPKSCTANIDVSLVPLAYPGYGKSYALRVMSVYGTSDVTVFADGLLGSVNLVEQQILVDVTAKAQDVLRRIQVRTSVSGTAPDFGVMAGGDGNGGICKRYAISAGAVVFPTGYPACDNL